VAIAVALGKATDLQIREQSDFVVWWKAHVTDKGGGNDPTGKAGNRRVTGLMSADQAEVPRGNMRDTALSADQAEAAVEGACDGQGRRQCHR
jgi:hypothetical protein